LKKKAHLYGCHGMRIKMIDTLCFIISPPSSFTLVF